MALVFKIDWQYGCYTGHADFVLGQADEPFQPDVPDGDIFSGQSFWMFEGNFGCDCNRVDSILREAGQFPWVFPEHYNHDVAPGEWSCGMDVEFTHVEFWRDDRYIGYGNDAEWGYQHQRVKNLVVVPTILERAIILRG